MKIITLIVSRTILSVVGLLALFLIITLMDPDDFVSALLVAYVFIPILIIFNIISLFGLWQLRKNTIFAQDALKICGPREVLTIIIILVCILNFILLCIYTPVLFQIIENSSL